MTIASALDKKSKYSYVDPKWQIVEVMAQKGSIDRPNARIGIV